MSTGRKRKEADVDNGAELVRLRHSETEQRVVRDVLSIVVVSRMLSVEDVWLMRLVSKAVGSATQLAITENYCGTFTCPACKGIIEIPYNAHLVDYLVDASGVMVHPDDPDKDDETMGCYEAWTRFCYTTPPGSEKDDDDDTI
jgi:hypothetical protein